MKTATHLLWIAGILLLAACTHKSTTPARTDAAEGQGAVYKIGDYYPDPNVSFSAPGVVAAGTAPTGIVYQIDAAASQDGGLSGTNGYIVSLIQTEGKGVPWDEDNYYTAASNPNDGRENMATVAAFIAANNKAWSNFNAIYWVVTTMNGQTDYDAQRDRWFLPSKNELKALYSGFSGKVYTEAWGDGYHMPGFDDPACVEARERFNAALVAAGGEPLDVSEFPYYWSSMEDYDSLAWIVNFRDGGYSLIDAKRYLIRVRAISAF